jgi:hypothetical protein
VIRLLLPRSVRRLARVLDAHRAEFERAPRLQRDSQREIVHRALDSVPEAAALAARAGHARGARALLSRQPVDAAWCAAGVPWADVVSAGLAETT